MGTSTSMMDKAGIEKIKDDGVRRFDLSATSVPKESVGLPLEVNEVAYLATDTDKPVKITLELPHDTLTVSTSDFKMAAWEAKSFMSEGSEGQQSLGMGIKNGTAMYPLVYWKKDSPVQVLQFSALVAPGYYEPEVQAEIAEFGRAPIGFKLDAQ